MIKIEKTPLEEIRRQKSLIRKEYLTIRRSVTPEEKKSFDDKIFNCLIKSMSYKYCKNILTYCSLSDEPDTTEFAKQVLKDGKPLFFPKSYKGGIMKFFLTDALDNLKPGAFGVSEPSESQREYSVGNSTDLCIVPGLCFDKYGYRIGYGKGYYDRFMTKFKGVTIGITYSRCIFPGFIPIEKRYDKPIDLIITEKGIEPVAQKQKI